MLPPHRPFKDKPVRQTLNGSGYRLRMVSAKSRATCDGNKAGETEHQTAETCAAAGPRRPSGLSETALARVSQSGPQTCARTAHLKGAPALDCEILLAQLLVIENVLR